MSLQQDIPKLLDVYKDHQDKIAHNEILFEILEGDLQKFILADLQAQLSKESFDQIKYRTAPINVLKRLRDKLSKIYAKPPLRMIGVKDKKDTDLLEYYDKEFDIDTEMSIANGFFNIMKTAAIEPFIYKSKPKLRVLPPHTFFVYSADTVNPMVVTHFVKIMGKLKVGDKERTLFFAYTADEFLAFDDQGEIVASVMSRPDVAVLEGGNPYGAIPFVYINKSRHCLVPPIDSDTLQMTKLIPILLSDLNFAVMFQAFSIMYGIDVDDENLKKAPNAFWRFKSEDGKEGKASVGVIKPEVDIRESMDLIQAQLNLWLNSRNIRPGSIGPGNTTAHMASGIAKAIDEMDTSEDRQEQIPFFKKAEADLWDLIIEKMHPVWMRDPGFEQKMAFSPGVHVELKFGEQRPIVDESKVLDDVIKKLQCAEPLESLKGALRTLNPDWTDDQIAAKIKEIQDDIVNRPKPVSGAPASGGGKPVAENINAAGDGEYEEDAQA